MHLLFKLNCIRRRSGYDSHSL